MLIVESTLSTWSALVDLLFAFGYFYKTQEVQSGASSQAEIGGAYFSGVTGSIQDPIAVPGPCDVTEP